MTTRRLKYDKLSITIIIFNLILNIICNIFLLNSDSAGIGCGSANQSGSQWSFLMPCCR